MANDNTNSTAPMPTTPGTITSLINGTDEIGGVYDMGYESCTINTNDAHLEEVGGLARTAYALAVPTERASGDVDTDSGYALLLRINGRTELPDENDLERMREETSREMVDDTTTHAGKKAPDPLTRAEMQRVAFDADIVGTFYEQDGSLVFGSDAESVYSTVHYRVFLPDSETLSKIASFPHSPNDEEVLPLGRVRYSSTERLGTGESAKVHFDPRDLLGLKSGFFGKTRTGKSNTMKIKAIATAIYSLKAGESVGQLIFDPSGEYANANDQDEEALGELPSDVVSIYGWNTEGRDNRRALHVNFYDDDIIDVIWSITRSRLTNTSNYIQSFKQVDPVGPSDSHGSESQRAKWRRSALYAAFAKAGLDTPSDPISFVNVNDEVLEVIENHTNADLPRAKTGAVVLHGGNIVEFWETVEEQKSTINETYEQVKRDRGQDPKPWVGPQLDAILDVLVGRSGSGYKLLEPLRQFHEPDSDGDYAAEIYRDLENGRIVIVDASVGTDSDSVMQYTAERIIRYIISRAEQRFSRGERPPDIQMYLEEAHRLFSRDHLERADDNDPYVWLGKEAAKFNIGLVYATQEVSGVHHEILANTDNWVVTHLNNDKEMNTLAKYENFDAYEHLIRNVRDKGFARVLTKSGRYIVPVQIDLFDADWIEQVRGMVESQEQEDMPAVDPEEAVTDGGQMALDQDFGNTEGDS